MEPGSLNEAPKNMQDNGLFLNDLRASRCEPSLSVEPSSMKRFMLPFPSPTPLRAFLDLFGGVGPLLHSPLGSKEL